jgi:hypothetical protein
LVNCLHVFQVGSDRWGSAGCLLDARLGRRPVAVCPAPSHWSCSLALHWRARGRSPSRFLAGPASRATTAFHQPTIIPLFQLGSLPLLHARPDFFYLTPCLPRTSRSFITFYDELPLAPETSRRAAAMADQSVFRITKVGRASLVSLCHRGVEALTMMPFPTTGAERPSKEFGSV